MKKLNRKCASLRFKKTCPCTILSPPFLIFKIAPLRGRYLKFTPPYKKGGPIYVSPWAYIRKTPQLYGLLFGKPRNCGGKEINVNKHTFCIIIFSEFYGIYLKNSYKLQMNSEKHLNAARTSFFTLFGPYSLYLQGVSIPPPMTHFLQGQV